ncbi:hypothetical protein SAMN04488541_101587 [Thermoflexibacter ruber]|uniref:Uncharacterized protein n=1 Tax=Thermoflexibacter ruber TaxID=1003 RepID=A0A1I2FW53_9BACT|nr:hypothetical protein SAMN04488541_101587 [Thermoflexibacter ruber]
MILAALLLVDSLAFIVISLMFLEMNLHIQVYSIPNLTISMENK